MKNLESNHRLQDCIVIRMKVRKVNRRDQLVIVMKHDDFKMHNGALEEIYCVFRWCKVTEEGSSDYFFDKEEGGRTVATRNETVTAEIQVELPVVVENLHNRGFLNGDLLNLNGDVEVDDDNAPAPENLPVADANVDEVFVEWGHDGVCERRQAGGQKTEVSLFNFGGHAGVPSILQKFEMMFPK